jgi:8-oxo-dGTP pyrophosphatase MutT (NUDIX family)
MTCIRSAVVSAPRAVASGASRNRTLARYRSRYRLTWVDSVSKVPTKLQFSAGGVAFRKQDQQIEVALISVGKDNRWQLPKGLVDKGESTEDAAVREVREEAGIDTEVIERIDKVEYWYFAKEQDQRVRYHKFVYFFLLRYRSGDVRNHDHEVNEARWVEIRDAIKCLAFATEKKIVERAAQMIDDLH